MESRSHFQITQSKNHCWRPKEFPSEWNVICWTLLSGESLR